MDKEYDPEQGLPSLNADEGKETGNVIGGLKASLSNDSNSDEAKSANQAKLDELESEGAQTYQQTEAE